MSYKRDQMQIHKILKGQFVNLFINHVRKRNLYNDYRMIYLSDRIKLKISGPYMKTIFMKSYIDLFD